MSYILLVEDNQANADMIIHILDTAGFCVEHFSRGFDGAKAARLRRPDLILMDFNLPDIDGQTLSFLLKKQLGGQAAPPIIACTARTGVRAELTAKQLGCSAFLAKPFTPEELLQLVAQFLPMQN